MKLRVRFVKSQQLLTVLDDLGFLDIIIEEAVLTFSASFRLWHHIKYVTVEDGEYNLVCAYQSSPSNGDFILYLDVLKPRRGILLFIVMANKYM